MAEARRRFDNKSGFTKADKELFILMVENGLSKLPPGKILTVMKQAGRGKAIKKAFNQTSCQTGCQILVDSMIPVRSLRKKLLRHVFSVVVLQMNVLLAKKRLEESIEDAGRRYLLLPTDRMNMEYL